MLEALRIAMESGRPYTGLRGFEVDPRLWHYVPRSLAEREHLVPVLLVGNTLKVAASRSDPDLSPLQTRYPNLQLEIVMAAPDEISDVLARSGQDA